MGLSGMKRTATGLVLIAIAGGSAVADGTSREGCMELPARIQATMGRIDAGGEGELEARRELLLLAEQRLECPDGADAGDPDGTARRGESALLFLRAAVPGEATAFDDPLRRVPGPGWGEYARLARELAEAPEASAGEKWGDLLLVPFLDDSEIFVDAGPLYSEEYYARALVIWNGQGSVVGRMRAAAFIVKCSIWCDWALACRIANAAAELERAAEPQSVSEAGALRSCINEVFDAIKHGLNRRSYAVRFALDQYASEHHEPIGDEVLLSPARLWDALEPWLGRGVEMDKAPPRLNANWTDLESNPFETTPGLRVVLGDPKVDGERNGPRIRRVYWEDLEESGQEPWTERYNRRREALGPFPRREGRVGRPGNR